MKLKLLAAVLLASAAFSATADDQFLPITLGTTYDFDDIGTPLAGGSDLITFTGLAAGTYNVLLSYHANNLQIVKAQLNGLDTFEIYSPSGSFSLGAFEVATNSPFTLALWGSNLTGGDPSYGGSITVTAVPEPATYGMLLGGLGLLGLAARRKKQS
jgi:hypothetical protein